MSPSLQFNNNNSNTLGYVVHHSHLRSSPSPVLKSRNLSSSLSFNRGTMIKPAIHNNGSSVIRASSFQSKLNPNGFSLLTGPGSDNDSLHSSTSSLECSSGVGGCLTLSKPGMYPSISPQEEYHLPPFPKQMTEKNENFQNKLQPTKFSYGNVSHSEKHQGSGILGISQSPGINHCSMFSLDLQIRDGEGGMANMNRGRGENQLSHSLEHSDTNWNGHHVNATAYGEEGYYGTRNHHQQKVTQMLKVPQRKVKEMPRLNKFPLDLDSLVNNTSEIKVQGRSMSPHHPNSPPMSSDDLYHPNPPSTSVSSSASLSSLEGSPDMLLLSFQHSYLSVLPRSLTPLQDPIKGAPASFPFALSTDQGPQKEISSGYQEVSFVSNQSQSCGLQGDNLSLRDVEGKTRDSVGSILQRIASFSLHATPDIIPVGIQYKPFQSDAGLSSPPDIKPRWKQEIKKQKGMFCTVHFYLYPVLITQNDLKHSHTYMSELTHRHYRMLFLSRSSKVKSQWSWSCCWWNKYLPSSPLRFFGIFFSPL